MNKLGLFGLLFFLCGCHHSDVHSNHQLRAVHIFGSIPIAVGDSSANSTNEYDIYYYDDLTMYLFEYGFDSTVNGKLLLHEKRPNYFVFQKDSSFGFSFYPRLNYSDTNARVSVDTVFKRNSYVPFSFDSMFNRKPDSSYFDSEKNLVKIYNSPVSDKIPEVFTYYLYYSKKFAGLTESFFSKSAKDEDGMKLFKVRMHAHGAYYEQYKMNLPPREFLYEMSEIPIKDSAGVMAYFNKYKEGVLN